MEVAPASGAAQARNSTQAASANDQASGALDVNYDTFLKLLIAQMKNQDPTNPMDATQQVSQLATFSQVEQTIQTNKNLESLLSQSVLSSAGSVIGRTITSADGSTSGVIRQVQVNSDGLTAVLTDGSTVDVGSGVTIE